MGGRRKKGLKEKVKEKLPGAHKSGTQTTTGHTTTAPPTSVGGTGAYGEEHEKPGIMGKIKEKLPGGRQ